jgi:hypothetical protein
MFAFQLSILLLCLAGLGEAAVGKTAKLASGTYVASHNRQRLHYGAKPLKYAGSKLQRGAQEWANQCKFKHSGGPCTRRSIPCPAWLICMADGENLAAVGSSPNPPGVNFYKHAMSPWIHEAKTYFKGGSQSSF